MWQEVNTESKGRLQETNSHPSPLADIKRDMSENHASSQAGACCTATTEEEITVEPEAADSILIDHAAKVKLEPKERLHKTELHLPALPDLKVHVNKTHQASHCHTAPVVEGAAAEPEAADPPFRGSAMATVHSTPHLSTNVLTVTQPSEIHLPPVDPDIEQNGNTELQDDQYGGDTDVESPSVCGTGKKTPETEEETQGTDGRHGGSAAWNDGKGGVPARCPLAQGQRKAKSRPPASNNSDSHAPPLRRSQRVASAGRKRPVRRAQQRKLSSSRPSTCSLTVSCRTDIDCGNSDNSAEKGRGRLKGETSVLKSEPVTKQRRRPHIGLHDRGSRSGSSDDQRSPRGSTDRRGSHLRSEDNQTSQLGSKDTPRSQPGSEEDRVMLYQCGICDKAYNHKNLLQQHMLNSSHTKVVRCGQCCQTFSNPEQLVVHARQHVSRPFLCSQCPATFISSTHLKRHSATHGEEKRFKCQDCPSAFHQLVNLKVHMRSHTGEKPYHCDQCPATFTLSGNLKRHRRTHTGEKPYVCDVCSRAFRVSSQLKVHLRIHTGEKSFQCSRCPAAFTQSSSLKTHLNLHMGVKPFSCDLCPAAFAESSNLKVHMRKHSGERPFLCEQCPRAFSQSSSLKKHRLIHSGERSFQCPLCPKNFRLPHGLKRHLVIHDEGRHFCCHHCPAKFLKKEYLRAHMFLHNGLKPWLNKKRVPPETADSVCGQDDQEDGDSSGEEEEEGGGKQEEEEGSSEDEEEEVGRQDDGPANATE